MPLSVRMRMCTGRLSDPNIDPAYLAVLVFIGSNEKVYMPSKEDIWQRYLRKFSKNGKLLENDPGVVTTLEENDHPGAPAPAPAACN